MVTSLTPGTVVVADRDAFGGAGGLIALDPGSGQQTALSQGQFFENPSGVTVAPDGTLVVTDSDAFGGGGGLIRVDPATGQQTKLVAGTVFSKPFGVAVEPDGMVVVAYSQRSTQGFGDVMRIDPTNGDHRRVAPSGQFFSPFFVALATNGDVLVGEIDPAGSGTDSRLYRVAKATGAQTTLSADQPPGAIFGGLAVEASGNVVLTNLPNHAPMEILRFDMATKTYSVVSRGGSLLSHFGIAVEASGTILVADQVNGIVRVEPSNGAQSTLSSGGGFVFPFALAIAP